MSTIPRPTTIDYPDSDGKPMADNTKQFLWIHKIEGNLEALFRDREDVFVAGDNLWYPVEGENKVRQAPDVYVVFGRPKGHRGSYRQWEEGGVPLTVVFEILSPSNTDKEMGEKLAFYDLYEVEEYYIYDPDTDKLTIYQRGRATLARVYPKNRVHVSRRLKIRFDLSGDEMAVFYPDGKEFLTFEQLEADREREREGRLAAEEDAREAISRADLAVRQAEVAKLQAEVAERQAAVAERQTALAKQQADVAKLQADQAKQQAARLVALSRAARLGKATPEQLAELEQLEAAIAPP